MLNIGEFDGDYTLAVVNGMREAFMDQKKTFKVNFYKGSRPFFFNREHANFHKKNWNTAWTEMLKFFSENL
jgi:dienelactone hydrolase